MNNNQRWTTVTLELLLWLFHFYYLVYFVIFEMNFIQVYIFRAIFNIALACNAKSFQLPLYPFFLLLTVGVSVMDLQNLFPKNSTILYPRSAWERSDFFTWTHWQIFYWWSNYSYLRRVWPVVCDEKLVIAKLSEHWMS